MPQNIVIRARIDEATKIRATAALEEIGLTLSEAFRLMTRKIARENSFPFDLFVPNAETVAAMQAAEHGAFEFSGSLEDSLAYLNAPD